MRIFMRWLLRPLMSFLSRHPYVMFVLGLIYLVVPVDFIPEVLAGPLGYLDDIFALLLSGLVMNRLRKKPPPSSSSQAQSKRPPHEVLGVSRLASKDEINRAYKKLMAEYHPDKVAHLGKDLQKLAHQKAVEIQEAYNSLSA